MGIWFIALSLPQITAAPVAGVLLDTFQHVGHQFGFRSLGYTVIFLLAVVYYLLSTLLVRKVRGVR
jgi:type III secretory pathway component EscS